MFIQLGVRFMTNNMIEEIPLQVYDNSLRRLIGKVLEEVYSEE